MLLIQPAEDPTATQKHDQQTISINGYGITITEFSMYLLKSVAGEIASDSFSSCVNVVGITRGGDC